MKSLISLSLHMSFLFLLGLTLPACSVSNSAQEGVKGVGPRDPGDKKPAPDKKPDPKELLVVDRFLQQSIQGLRTSHEIFSELWMHIWADRMSRPQSIFLDLRQLIEIHRDPKTNHFNLKNIQCPERMTQIFIKPKAANNPEVASVTLQVADCSDMKDPKWQDMAVFTVLGANSVRWDIFNQYFPRGAGKHLAAEKNRSKCTAVFLDERRLKTLNCEFVGQSRDNESHLLFSRMDYDRTSDLLVVAEGKKYKNGQEACSEAKYCTIIKVPAEGSIEVVETLRPDPATPTLAPVIDPADLNAVGEPLPKVDPQF